MLYGFAHADERRCFEALLGAHGVGPSLALAILSALSPAALSTAVLEDDVDTLCLVPGVGKKTAARLAARAEGPARPARRSTAGRRAPAAGRRRPGARSGPRWPSSGYGPDEIRRALDGGRRRRRRSRRWCGRALRELARDR